MTVRETLTWELYGEASAALGRQVADSGFVPDIVLGIARGGLGCRPRPWPTRWTARTSSR